MNEQIAEILKNFNLRITDCRTGTLDMFLERAAALSNADLEEKLGIDFDRVTIYRTLRTFLDKRHHPQSIG
ncbi:MAG: hypothetical protein HC880_15685 [Bacteroidia bacterium]|nr:hypothetical protein [Bacteroidia bacterium]